jgi:hypothetical protein
MSRQACWWEGDSVTGSSDLRSGIWQDRRMSWEVHWEGRDVRRQAATDLSRGRQGHKQACGQGARACTQAGGGG